MAGVRVAIINDFALDYLEVREEQGQAGAGDGAYPLPGRMITAWV